ncbi:MAG: Dph6-related ATP pyrophosphatase [Planctomycetota bacterium]|jgi:uncharacterized protein (TIGR00290 family)
MTDINKTRILLAWSSGKDAAWTLHVLRQQNDVEVVGLLTTVNDDRNRVSMHGVSEQLLDRQAAAMSLPIIKIYIPYPCSNDQYQKVMGQFIQRAQTDNIKAVAFGDLFLEDIRKYREEKMAGTGIRALFPLWGVDTTQLAREMVSAGLRAHITCVDTKQLDPSFAGRTYDPQLLDDLPSNVDPCGEHGEFHTFVYQAPVFEKPLHITPGKVVRSDEFVFADIAE